MKAAYICVGIISIILGMLGVFNGYIHGLGALGVGDTVYRISEPRDFWFTVVSVIGFGSYMFYIAFKK